MAPRTARHKAMRELLYLVAITGTQILAGYLTQLLEAPTTSAEAIVHLRRRGLAELKPLLSKYRRLAQIRHRIPPPLGVGSHADDTLQDLLNDRASIDFHEIFRMKPDEFNDVFALINAAIPNPGYWGPLAGVGARAIDGRRDC